MKYLFLVFFTFIASIYAHGSEEKKPVEIRIINETKQKLSREDIAGALQGLSKTRVVLSDFFFEDNLDKVFVTQVYKSFHSGYQKSGTNDIYYVINAQKVPSVYQFLSEKSHKILKGKHESEVKRVLTLWVGGRSVETLVYLKNGKALNQENFTKAVNYFTPKLTIKESNHKEQKVRSAMQDLNTYLALSDRAISYLKGSIAGHHRKADKLYREADELDALANKLQRKQSGK